MKLIALFSGLALTGLMACILGVALDTQPLSLFAFAIGALVLLVTAGDYAQCPTLVTPRSADIVSFVPTPAVAEATTRLAA